MKWNFYSMTYHQRKLLWYCEEENHIWHCNIFISGIKRMRKTIILLFDKFLKLSIYFRIKYALTYPNKSKRKKFEVYNERNIQKSQYDRYRKWRRKKSHDESIKWHFLRPSSHERVLGQCCNLDCFVKKTKCDLLKTF